MTIWQRFLLKAGAHDGGPEGSAGESFGDARAEQRAALTRSALYALPELGVIHVEGADAREFLHGQLTQDLLNLEAGRWTRAAWCSAKGRALAVFRVIPQDQGFDLLLPAALVPPVLARLRLFVLRSRVELSDDTETRPAVGLSGTDAGTLLRQSDYAAPSPGHVRHAGEVSILGLDGSPPRFILLGPTAQMVDAWQALVRDARPCGMAAWNLLEVINGEPTVLAQTQDRFVPQMLNLHWLDGINFRKGCYPGQEVVARMQYLGHLKRRMFLASVERDGPVAPGEAVHTAGNSQAVGSVVNASPHPQGGQWLLAVLRIDAAESQALRLGSPQGEPLHLRELPYTVGSASPEAGASAD